MVTTQINYIEFQSQDYDASRRFFAQAFGWSFTDYGPDYCGLDAAGLDGGIARAAEPVPPLVVLYAEDFDAALAAVTAAGGTIVKAPYDFPGGRRFHVREPGGNELAVWSDPLE